MVQKHFFPYHSPQLEVSLASRDRSRGRSPEVDGSGYPMNGSVRSEADDLLRVAVAHSPTIYYVAQFDGSRLTRYISENVEVLTGFAPERFLDNAGFGASLLHPDDRERYHRAIDRLADVRYATLEYRLANADGDYLWFRDDLKLVEAERGGDQLFVGCMQDITRERLAEAHLDDALAMVSALVGSALDAVITVDDQGVIREFNPAAESMFGYSRDEAVGQAMAELLIPDTFRQQHLAGMERFRRTGKVSLANRRIVAEALRRDGSTFPCELTIADTVIDDHTIFIGEIRDISDRISAQRERDRMAGVLQTTVDSIPAGICITDPQDRITLCNSAFASLYACTTDEMMGMTRDETMRRLLPRVESIDGQAADSSEAGLAALVHKVRTAPEKPVELHLKDGTYWLIWGTRRDDGTIINVRTDITPIKQAEDTARETAELIRCIVESSPVPLGMTRARSSEVIYESPASAELFGRDSAGTAFYAVNHFVNRADRDRYVQQLESGGRVDDFEVEMQRSDGSRFWAALSSQLVQFQGEPVIVSSSFDLTERKRIDNELSKQRDALYQSEKLAALGEMLASVAHELNNPLSIVVGQALLLRELASEPTIADRAEKIGKAADRCARIVKTFLAMAREGPKRNDVVNLRSVIMMAVEATQYALRVSDVELTLDMEDNVPAVLGDADQLAQVFTNLLFNAEQVLRNISTARKVVIRVRSGADGVLIAVRDNGPGMSQEVKRRIFEPLFTTKDVGAGTGIGLALCHRIVDAHGGRISVKSTPGGGATFRVRLPALQGTVSATDEKPAAKSSRRSSRRILVIDDEPEVGEVISTFLRAEGYRVDFVKSGIEALNRIARIDYDAVISDLRMPLLDGPRLFDHLTERFPEMIKRLGFVTGDTISDSAQKFLRRAGCPHIEKPVTRDDLRRIIGELV